MQPYHWISLLLLLCYFALHSLLAADAVKISISRLLSSHFRYYRLLYNAVAFLFLIGILIYMYKRHEEPLIENTLLLKGIGVLMLFAGLILNVLPMRQYGLLRFIGLRLETPGDEPAQLITNGLNGLVRHPLYLGALMLLIGIFCWMPILANAIFLSSVVLYLPLGIYFEEKKLVKRFGDDYVAYQKKVKRLLPWIW